MYLRSLRVPLAPSLALSWPLLQSMIMQSLVVSFLRAGNWLVLVDGRWICGDGHVSPWPVSVVTQIFGPIWPAAPNLQAPILRKTLWRKCWMNSPIVEIVQSRNLDASILKAPSVHNWQCLSYHRSLLKRSTVNLLSHAFSFRAARGQSVLHFLYLWNWPISIGSCSLFTLPKLLFWIKMSVFLAQARFPIRLPLGWI